MPNSSQFLAVDVIVVGAPLYNFSIPSQLKAWIDRVAQAGRTFTYTATGPKGLAGGKTVIVASTRGGVYSTREGGRAMEHQESYLQMVFGFLGIADVRFVRAEGLAMGDAKKAEALVSAAEQAHDATRTVAKPAAGCDGSLMGELTLPRGFFRSVLANGQSTSTYAGSHPDVRRGPNCRLPDHAIA